MSCREKAGNHAQWQAKKQSCPASLSLTPGSESGCKQDKTPVWLLSTPPFLPPEGVPTENKWAQLPSAHTVLVVPEDSGGHECGVNLSGRSIVKWQSNLLGFQKTLLSLAFPKQQKYLGLISLGHKSSKKLYTKIHLI